MFFKCLTLKNSGIRTELLVTVKNEDTHEGKSEPLYRIISNSFLEWLVWRVPKWKPGRRVF